MAKVGTLGHDMMFRSCTIQTNIDFEDEADMVEKMRIGVALQPIATALFANSPLRGGKPSGQKPVSDRQGELAVGCMSALHNSLSSASLGAGYPVCM